MVQRNRTGEEINEHMRMNDKASKWSTIKENDKTKVSAA
jgi:hypothetical protein